MTHCTFVLTAVLSVLLLSPPDPAHAQALNDHLKCYQVKDALNLAAVVDLNSPQYGLEAGCKVSKAKFFCVPAEKTVVSAEDKKTHLPIAPLPVGGPDAGDRICYKIKCPVTNIPDQPVTDQFGSRTVTKFKASYLCTPAVKGTYQRFVDNGDGTITDNQTGLQWEQKTTAPGSGEDLANPHDVDNVYSWSVTAGPPDGTVFTDFLGKVNNCTSPDGIAVVNPGFAGHCDWRLPTIQELVTIIDLSAAGCGSGGPCVDPIFEPIATAPFSYYWSSTRSTMFGGGPLFVHVDAVQGGNEFSGGRVRAVRRAW